MSARKSRTPKRSPKKQTKRNGNGNGKKVQARRDWDKTIERFMESRYSTTRISMGSPNSAQVTRCRIMDKYEDRELTFVDVYTEGNVIVFEKTGHLDARKSSN